MKLLDRMEELRSAWSSLASRSEGYDLVLPGSPSFICQPKVCSAHCCKAFSVSLGAREVGRLKRASLLAPLRFLESENGEPITLPLAKPFLLSRSDGHCTLLAESLGCSQYHGRPDACRLYPHFILPVDRPTGRREWAAPEDVFSAVRSFLLSEPAPVLPLLVRHRECHGFTGPPLELQAWCALLTETATLQFPDGRGQSLSEPLRCSNAEKPVTQR